MKTKQIFGLKMVQEKENPLIWNILCDLRKTDKLKLFNNNVLQFHQRYQPIIIHSLLLTQFCITNRYVYSVDR